MRSQGVVSVSGAGKGPRTARPHRPIPTAETTRRGRRCSRRRPWGPGTRRGTHRPAWGGTGPSAGPPALKRSLSPEVGPGLGEGELAAAEGEAVPVVGGVVAGVVVVVGAGAPLSMFFALSSSNASPCQVDDR